MCLVLIIYIGKKKKKKKIYVRGGQSARDDKSHIRTLRAECACR